MLAAQAVDWSLTAAERAELDGHLATCPACRATRHAVTSQATMLRARPRALAPAGMRERIAMTWESPAAGRGDGTLRLVLVFLALLMLLGAIVVVAGSRGPELPTTRPAVVPAAVVPAAVLPDIGTAATFHIPVGPISGECTLIVTSGCSTDTVLAFGSVWTTSRHGVERVAPDTGTSQATIPVGGDPIRLLATDDAIWATVGSGSLVRIDPTTSKVTGSVPIDERLGELAWYAGAVWVADVDGKSIVRVAPGEMQVHGAVVLDIAPWSLATTSGALWVTDRYAQHLLEIDTRTMTVARSLDVPDAIPMSSWDYGDGLVATDDRVYVASGESMAAFDPTTATFRTTPTPVFPHLALTPDGVWLLSVASNVLQRLDPSTLELKAQQSVALSRELSAVDWEASMAADGGSIWLQSYRDGLIRITRH